MNESTTDTSPLALPSSFPRSLTLTLWIFVGLGAVTLLAGILGFSTQRIWITYLINFCFWGGLAQAGVVFSAAYRITNGKWGESIRRVSEGFVLFVPLSALLFLVTFLGREYLWPWIVEPIPAKAAWLNEPFFFIRVFLYFILLAVLSLHYVRISIRPDVGFLKEKGVLQSSRTVEWLTRSWQGYGIEIENRSRKLSRLVPILLIAYGVIYSFVGFDLVMSLDPHWYSTLYGWLYFIHAFNAGVAGTVIVAIIARRSLHLEERIPTRQFYDVSRLLMGICMLSGGFYWSQYLVIWYGNLGEEIERMIVRFSHDPWPPYQWGVIALLYFFPIIVFLSRAIKERPQMLLIIASVILIANWFYQFVEIAPAVWREVTAPLGIAELTMTLGFLGAVGLCWLTYARLVPLVQFGQRE